MRRLAYTLVLALAVVLFWPAAAQAKAPTEAVVTGPGNPRPVTVTSDGIEAWGPADPVKKLCDATGFSAVAGFAGNGMVTDPVANPPVGALGPAYRVDFGQWGTATVYPFAAGGPWSELAGLMSGTDGWVEAEPAVVPLLRELGVQLTPPSPPAKAAPAKPAPVADPAPASSPLDPGVVTAAVVAIVLAPLAILLLRRRRRFAG